MIKNKDQRPSVFLLLPLLLITIILEITTLPPFLEENRPYFPVLVLIFFSSVIHVRFCMEFAWISGLIIDLLVGAPLGINALTFCAQVYLISWQFKEFNHYSLWQQALSIGVVSYVVRIVAYWIAHLILHTNYEINFVIPSVILALLWIPASPLLKVFTGNSGTANNASDNN